MTTILFGILSLLTLASIVVFLGGFGSMRIRARKIHNYFTTLFVVGLLMLLVSKITGTDFSWSSSAAQYMDMYNSI